MKLRFVCLFPTDKSSAVHDKVRPPRPAATTDVLRTKLVKANRSAKVIGLNELPGKSNYFIGNDPKTWRRNVPPYGKVSADGGSGGDWDLG